VGLQLQDEASSVSSIAVDTSRIADKQHFDTLVRRIEKEATEEDLNASLAFSFNTACPDTNPGPSTTTK
jgi:hypothetical protein